ncbi:MAG: MATE family efflux transporter [Bacteroides sp.]|nr:MATE family efflux transporter [Prevotella sp.]MCM1408051.1 MATE family efflux transporter [Treponema brennaborense]MCM1469027.1 MATE family efflux transporter [Bacteroides sp.]
MQAVSSSGHLETEPIGKLLFRLSVPAITAQLVNMFYNIADRMYIGRIPGDGAFALTGVGVCLPVIMIVSAFAALVSMGGAPRASVFMGQRDISSAEQTLGNCFSMQLCISAILTAALLPGSEKFLRVFGASANTLPYACRYMQIYAAGTVFVQLTLGMNAFITAQGFAFVGMKTVLIGAAANIILDPLFIFGAGLGVRGAALATVLSQAISAAWTIRFLTGKKTILKLRIRNLHLRHDVIFPCIALGFAPFIMQSSESFIAVCFNSSLLKYGGDIAVGAMTILTSVMQFALMPIQGLAQGAQPISSYNYGAGNAVRVKKTFRLLLLCCLCYSIILWAAVELFPAAFSRMFSSDAALIDFTANALRVYCAAMFMFGIQMPCQMTFISLGNARASAIVAIVRKFVLLLPFIYAMPKLAAFFPALFSGSMTTAVYFAEPAADILAVTFTAVLFSAQFKKALRSLPLTAGLPA